MQWKSPARASYHTDDGVHWCRNTIPCCVPLVCIKNSKTHIPGFRLPIPPCRDREVYVDGMHRLAMRALSENALALLGSMLALGKWRRRWCAGRWRNPSHYDWLSFDSAQINKYARLYWKHMACLLCAMQIGGYYDESNVRTGNDDGKPQTRIIPSSRVIGTPGLGAWRPSERNTK